MCQLYWNLGASTFWNPQGLSRPVMGLKKIATRSSLILTLILLTWKIRWAPNNASKWQMGFNSALKGLNRLHKSNVYKSNLNFLHDVVAHGPERQVMCLLHLLAAPLVCPAWLYDDTWGKRYDFWITDSISAVSNASPVVLSQRVRLQCVFGRLNRPFLFIICQQQP